jgi:hypothetical protein
MCLLIAASEGLIEIAWSNEVEWAILLQQHGAEEELRVEPSC